MGAGERSFSRFQGPVSKHLSHLEGGRKGGGGCHHLRPPLGDTVGIGVGGVPRVPLVGGDPQHDVALRLEPPEQRLFRLRLQERGNKGTSCCVRIVGREGGGGTCCRRGVCVCVFKEGGGAEAGEGSLGVAHSVIILHKRSGQTDHACVLPIPVLDELEWPLWALHPGLDEVSWAEAGVDLLLSSSSRPKIPSTTLQSSEGLRCREEGAMGTSAAISRARRSTASSKSSRPTVVNDTCLLELWGTGNASAAAAAAAAGAPVSVNGPLGYGRRAHLVASWDLLLMLSSVCVEREWVAGQRGKRGRGGC